MIKKNKKNGFTLVELLAVIVILAIVLVIAVPKVMSVIEDSKKATLESTAKMIASTAEKQKVQNTVLGKETQITCDSVAKINKLDYEDCDIEFDDNTAKVTIKGSGKFEGLNVCEGTKIEAQATEESCEKTCLIGYEEKRYTVKDYDSCMDNLNHFFFWYGYEDEEINKFCSGNSLSSAEKFSALIELLVYSEGNEKETELIENNVINEPTIVNTCITEETPTSCFEYEKIKEYNIKNYDSCVSYLTDVYISDGWDLDYVTNSVNAICSGNGYDGNSLEEWFLNGINNEYYTLDDLIDNNVIEVQELNEYVINNYDISCNVSSLIVPSKINGLEVTKIDVSSFDKIGYNYPSFINIVFPSSVNYIKNNDCHGLYPIKNLYIGNPNVVVERAAFDLTGYVKVHNLPDTYDPGDGCNG